MTEPDAILSDLVALAHHLGDKSREYAIVGEGNISARRDDGTFWVKASGESLRTIDAGGFVRLHLDRVLQLLDTAQTDEDVTRGFEAARADPGSTARPSIETFLHALVLAQGGARFAGHTHPIAINAILCSQQPDVLLQHITPDAITVCGAAPVFVSYHDVGLALGRAVRDALKRNIEEHGEPPRVIYLQNHGVLVLGQSARQVENVTAMAVKNARIMAQTFALGGPRPLAPADVVRIDKRTDEIVRRNKFEGRAG